jgi:outer membrane protein TolC
MGSSGYLLSRLRGRALVMLLSFLTLAAGGARAADVTGTMPEDHLPELKRLLQTALERSPHLIASAIDVALQEARLDLHNAARLPSLRSHVVYGANRAAISADTTRRDRNSGLFYSVSTDQAIFHWGALKNQSELGRINLLISQKSYAEASRSLAVMLRQMYLALIAKKTGLLQAREAFRLAEQELETERARGELGAVAPSAIAMRELGLRESRLELDRRELDFAADCRRLARIAGVGGLPEDQVPNEIPKPAHSGPLTSLVVSEILRDGAKSTYQYEIYAMRVREADLRYRIERVRLLPKLFASASHSIENTTNVTGTDVAQESVTRDSLSLNAQWAIFDGFATRGAKREAIAYKRRAERELDAMVEETLERAQMFGRQVALEAEAVELSEVRLQLARYTVERTTEEFEFGNVPRNAIEAAQAGVRLAEARAAEARASYFSRWSEFISHAGHDPLVRNLPVRHARQQR